MSTPFTRHYTTDAPVPDLHQIEAMAVLVAQARIAGHTMDQAQREQWSLVSFCTRDGCGAWVEVQAHGTTNSEGLSEPCRRSPERGLPAVYDRETGEG